MFTQETYYYYYVVIHGKKIDRADRGKITSLTWLAFSWEWCNRTIAVSSPNSQQNPPHIHFEITSHVTHLHINIYVNSVTWLLFKSYMIYLPDQERTGVIKGSTVVGIMTVLAGT